VVAIKNLAEKGLVNHEHYGYVELTPKGEEVAQEIYHRHQVLTQFLSKILGLDPKLAEQDACKIEHYISPLTLERLVKFVEFVDNFPTEGQDPKWLTYFRQYVKTGDPPPCKMETSGEEE
jgi:DtxR family Mn-dependent transcriptional regulator